MIVERKTDVVRELLALFMYKYVSSGFYSYTPSWGQMTPFTGLGQWCSLAASAPPAAQPIMPVDLVG